MMARSRALARIMPAAASRRREEVVTEEQVEAEPPVGSVRLERAETGRQVRSALAALPEEQRRALELAFFGGLSHSQIADRLGAPLGTVKSRVLLGMRKLRQALAGLLPPELAAAG
jgi:RNA polymerase sigma-70 factor (ECF subfamily)